MNHADTPIPGKDPGVLIEDPVRLDEIEPAVEEDIEANPQPKSTPTVPADDDPEVEDTEVQPT